MVPLQDPGAATNNNIMMPSPIGAGDNDGTTATSTPAAAAALALTSLVAHCVAVVGENGTSNNSGLPKLVLRHCEWLLSTIVTTGTTNYDGTSNNNYNSSSSSNNTIGYPGLVGFDETGGVLGLDTYDIVNEGLSSIHGGVNDTDADFQSFYDQLFASPEMRLRDHLVRYVYPIIIILGNITNLLVLLVFRRQKLRSTSVAIYLCAYAIANLCVLDLMLGVTWICIIFEKTYITMLADWTCRLWMFITNVMTYTGIWLVVAVNVDRLIYIKVPSSAQGYCTVFSAKTVVSFVVIGLVVVSIHAMWTYELQPQGCFVSFQPDLHTIIWPWWSATVYSYIPLALLLVLSIVQLVTLCARRFGNQSSPTSRAYEGGDNFVTAVLIISISFVVLTVPTTAINLVDINLPSDWLEADVIARIELAKNITEMLSSLNNSIMGGVLFMCSADFRSELFKLLKGSCCCCCARDRTLKGGVEMRNIAKSEDSVPHIQIDYELCNNNEENNVTNV